MVARNLRTRKAGKVLVINSDPEIIHILEVYLTQANLEIVTARSGSEALRKLQSDKADIIVLDPALPDIEGAEIYAKITDSYLTTHIPIILLSARLPRKNRIAGAENIPIYHITKPFEPKEVVALVQGYLMYKDRMVRINPLTGLPNRSQVNKGIDRLIKQKKTFTALYITLHDLKAVNKACGYSLGDRLVKLMVDTVSEAVCLSGNTEDMAGYLGRDKLVVISTPLKARALCRNIIANFNQRVQTLLDEEYQQLEQTNNEETDISREQLPAMSIHIAVVSNQKRSFHDSRGVSEAASEQIRYLKRSPESNCYFDLKASGIGPFLTFADKDLIPDSKKGQKTIQKALGWFDFLISELNNPMYNIRDSLHSFKSTHVDSLSQEQVDGLDILHNHCDHLNRIVEGISNLIDFHDGGNGAHFDEIDIESILSWALEQVHELAQQNGIKVDYKAGGDIGRIILNKKSLTQSILYIVRSVIKSSPPESNIRVRLTEKGDEYISIDIINPKHYIPSRELKNLLIKHFESPQKDTKPAYELYPARILLHEMGGEVDITSVKGRGTNYHIMIPKKWSSWIQEVDNLQLAMDISRKEARKTLEHINQIISSYEGKLPPALQENLEILGSKVQEMGVLCNRSLFLADEFSSQLESQLDRILQHEVEQAIALEVILTPCREIAKSMNVTNIFELDSARRVARYALSIAGEFKIPENERKALRYAALFKDLGLALSPNDMLEHTVMSKIEEAMAIKVSCDLICKALSSIGFLAPAMEYVRYRCERHDGAGGSFGVKGNDIPLGARILAIADTFDAMTSGRLPQGKLTPELAMQKIVADSGRRFDPDIVNTLQSLWKRKELEPVLSGN